MKIVVSIVIMLASMSAQAGLSIIVSDHDDRRSRLSFQYDVPGYYVLNRGHNRPSHNYDRNRRHHHHFRHQRHYYEQYGRQLDAHQRYYNQHNNHNYNQHSRQCPSQPHFHGQQRYSQPVNERF